MPFAAIFEMPLCCPGACQCIVARLFAGSRKVAFQDLRVEPEGDLDRDGFLKGKDGLRAGLSEIGNRHDPVRGSRPAGGSRNAAFGFTIGSQAHLGQ